MELNELSTSQKKCRSIEDVYQMVCHETSEKDRLRALFLLAKCEETCISFRHVVQVKSPEREINYLYFFPKGGHFAALLPTDSLHPAAQEKVRDCLENRLFPIAFGVGSSGAYNSKRKNVGDDENLCIVGIRPTYGS